MDYRESELRSETIPELHQAIIPSYRFTCCGNITEWGVDVHPAGGNHDMIYNLDLQVWRPSPTVQTTGCYSLVGINRFTSVSLTNSVAVVTPLPQEWIEFQPGDVLGFNIENINVNTTFGVAASCTVHTLLDRHMLRYSALTTYTTRKSIASLSLLNWH